MNDEELTQALEDLFVQSTIDGVLLQSYVNRFSLSAEEVKEDRAATAEALSRMMGSNFLYDIDKAEYELIGEDLFLFIASSLILLGRIAKQANISATELSLRRLSAATGILKDMSVDPDKKTAARDQLGRELESFSTAIAAFKDLI